MSFDATNPEHHDQFTKQVFAAFEKDWLNNANQQSMAKEGRPLTEKQRQDIRDKAERWFANWLAEIYDQGYTGDPGWNPYRKENQ